MLPGRGMDSTTLGLSSAAEGGQGQVPSHRSVECAVLLPQQCGVGPPWRAWAPLPACRRTRVLAEVGGASSRGTAGELVL